MRGDKLASGEHSATFTVKADVPRKKNPNEIEVEVKAVFGECRDCPFVAYSAKEFSDHAHGECPKPIVALPFVKVLSIGEKSTISAAAVEPGHYLAFCDVQTIDCFALRGLELPPGITMDFIALKLKPGQKIEDAVQLYQVKK